MITEIPSELPSLGSALTQLAVVGGLVLANGFFVAAEFALVSVRKTRIDQLAAEGSAAAVVVKKAVHDLDRYIAATQVGITIASLILGGYGEPALVRMIGPLFVRAGLPEHGTTFTAGAISIAIAYFIMTSMHVIIGELMPKSIALQQPEKVALLLGRPMTLAAKLFTPLIWMLNGTGNFLLKILGLHGAAGHDQVHSPEELDLLFAQSHDAGELTKTEFEILHRVVKFSDLTAREIMVPRVEMKAIPLTMTRGELAAYLYQQPHTRVPVFHGSLDELVGIAHLKDLVKLTGGTPAAEGDGVSINLMPIVRDTARVPETITVDRLLVEFKKRRQQMAIVIDEYGGTSGIVTMGDILEQAFGDVHDEFDEPEPEIQKLPDGRVRLHGRVLIEEVNERFHTGFPTDDADTIAGLVLHGLGRIAASGDEVEICGAKLHVEEIDRQRIVTITLELPPENEDAKTVVPVDTH